MNDRNKRLSEEKIGKLLFSFALPAITAMMINALYGVVDRVFVGRGVGSEAIAGVMIGMPIMMVMMALGMLIGFGGATSISIYLGQKKKEEAEDVVGNALSLFVIISLTLTAVGLIFLHPILILFGASDNTLPYAEKFVRIIIAGSLVQAIGFGMSNLIRAEGNPTYSMITQITGALSNILFCYIFIFIFKWGIAGSAIATVLAQTIVTVMVLSYFYTKKSVLHIGLKHLRLKKEIVMRILTIGASPFSMQFALAIILIIFNSQLTRYGGDIALSAWGAINSIMMLIMMPVFGLNQGAQPIVGYNYGAKNYDRVKKTVKLTMLAATAIVSAGYILVQLFAPQIISAFATNDPALMAAGSHGLRMNLLLLPIIGFQISGANFFQFTGRPKHSMFLGLSRQVLFLIPAVIVLPLFFGLNGVWLAGPVSDGISSLVTGFFVFTALAKLKGDAPVSMDFEKKESAVS